MIKFNIPPCIGKESEYIAQAIESHKICGDGAFTKRSLPHPVPMQQKWRRSSVISGRGTR